MRVNLEFRVLALIGFLGCTAGIGLALYLQYADGLEPCPMCIFQRIALIGTGLVLLVAALHGPRYRGRWVYAVLAASMAALGGAIAARQVWLQSLPADQVPACGPTLGYLLSILPVSKVISTVLKGDGSCAVIQGRWLGLTLPMWTLIAFIGMFGYAVALPFVSRKHSRISR